MPINPHVQLACRADWDARANATPAHGRVRCIVRVTFADGYETDVEATAKAWSDQAVEVFFPHPDTPGPAYRVWVPLERVRRIPD